MRRCAIEFTQSGASKFYAKAAVLATVRRKINVRRHVRNIGGALRCYQTAGKTAIEDGRAANNNNENFAEADKNVRPTQECPSHWGTPVHRDGASDVG